MLSVHHPQLSTGLVLSFRGRLRPGTAIGVGWRLDKLEGRNVEQIGVMNPEPPSAVGLRRFRSCFPATSSGVVNLRLQVYLLDSTFRNPQLCTITSFTISSNIP